MLTYGVLTDHVSKQCMVSWAVSVVSIIVLYKKYSNLILNNTVPYSKFIKKV